MMMVAPAVRLNLYDKNNPTKVNSIEKSDDKNIIIASELESLIARYIGIVSSAITSMRPTSLIAMTILKAESMSIKV